MRIAGFRAIRPAEESAALICAPPYDVVTEEEARKIREINPLSFLRITRAEVDLPRGISAYSDAVYAKAAENFRRFQSDGLLVQDENPCLFAYRQTMGSHTQTGIVALCHVEDYLENRIRKHENTLETKLQDRVRHIQALSGDAEPVLLFYTPVPALANHLQRAMNTKPLYGFRSAEGVRHELWRIERWEALVEAFTAVEICHIADGHHRVAAAADVALARKELAKEDGSNWFLAVLFPSNELKILPYNRCIKDLGGLSPETFLRAVRDRFEVFPDPPLQPERRGLISMYFQGRWFGLICPTVTPDPVASLDVSILQNELLDPLLGIRDPRRDPRIEFIGGADSLARIVRAVDEGRCAVGFSLYPVDVSDVMTVADAGQTMPPKSTWFEPKLLSGLFAYVF
ncbi:MAG: DUF1015 domain-containing protein [Kiritimatiellia bacterium]